jgi:glycosyltransferase involved in cell wall biosynthesis
VTRLTIDLRMYRNSGIGRYLQNLMPQLLPLLHADRIRIIVTPNLLRDRHTKQDPAWLRDPRIEVHLTSAAVYSPKEQFLPLTRAYRDNTLLWVPHYNAPLLYRGRLALTIHDIAPIALPQIMGNALKAAYASLLIRRSVAHADTIVCDSEATAAELRNHLHTDPDKLTVVPLGLDEHWPSNAVPHQEPDGTPYLLYVGNVKPNKNLSLLLTAFKGVQHQLPHRLVLAGRMRGFGTGDEAVIRQAEAFGPRARFTDEIPDAELIALYAGADALVLPSLYEGFGLPLLEAMQMGCPVLSSNSTSLPEIGGDAALYFDPHSAQSCADCLLRVLDRPLMDRLRTAGRIRAASFTYAHTAAQTAAILNHQLHRDA